jgi:hypothetical protein
VTEIYLISVTKLSNNVLIRNYKIITQCLDLRDFEELRGERDFLGDLALGPGDLPLRAGLRVGDLRLRVGLRVGDLPLRVGLRVGDLALRVGDLALRAGDLRLRLGDLALRVGGALFTGL